MFYISRIFIVLKAFLKSAKLHGEQYIQYVLKPWCLLKTKMHYTKEMLHLVKCLKPSSCMSFSTAPAAESLPWHQPKPPDHHSATTV